MGNLNNLEDEIRTFIAVLFLSGYCKVPYRNWPDPHLADNTQTTEDKYYNVWVLFEKLNFDFKQYVSIANHTALMKALFLAIKNTAQNNSLEESPLGLGLNVAASLHLKDIYFMQNHIVE